MSSNSTTNHIPYFAIYILQTIQIILKNLINKQKVGHYSCIFRRSPYLCIVFFIVLDLRLTRLGYSGIPFFLLIRHITRVEARCYVSYISLQSELPIVKLLTARLLFLKKMRITTSDRMRGHQRRPSQERYRLDHLEWGR